MVKLLLFPDLAMLLGELFKKLMILVEKLLHYLVRMDLFMIQMELKVKKLIICLDLRSSNNDVIEDYAKKFNVEFYAGKRPWEIKVDVALPCATQNEI